MSGDTTDQPAVGGRRYQGVRTGGRSARVRESILRAALIELLESGYEGLSLPRVAERAGVALSTIHRRWEGKAALVADAIGQVTAAKVPDPDGADLRGDLLTLARSVAAMVREPATQQVLRTAFLLDDADLDRLRHDHWAQRFAVAQRVADRAMRRGELPAGTDGWSLVEPVFARIWMRVLVTGLPIDDAYLARAVDAAIAAARRGELA